MLFNNEYRSTNYLDHKILGDLAMELGELDRAIMHYKKEIEYIFQCYEEDVQIYDIDSIRGVYILSEIYKEIVEAYKCKKDYDNAIEYTKLIIEDDEYRGVNKGMAVIDLARLHILNGQKEIAEEILIDLLDYEVEQMKKEYDGSYPKSFFDNSYEKDLYMQACYELINLFKDIDFEKGLHYVELALNIYNDYGKKDMGSEGARILQLQAEFYEKYLESKLKNNKNIALSLQNKIDIIQKICRNNLVASKIYLDDLERENSQSAIFEAINIYNKYNLDDYKLDFELKYQLANMYDELSYLEQYSDKSKTLEKYLDAFEILKEHDFFDEYSKNMILIQLAHYIDDYDISQNYLSQCDYYYIAQYNVEHSNKRIVSFIKEYKEAGESYKNCKNYDMALKCYEISLENLISLGIFEGRKIKEDEFDEFYLDFMDLDNLGYNSYIRICEEIARVYDEKQDYKNELKYLNKALDCVKKYRADEEFRRYNYISYAVLYERIVEVRIKMNDYRNVVEDYLFIIGIYNSQNKEASINEECKDILLLSKLLENNKLTEYILSYEYKFNLRNEWVNKIKQIFEEVIKIGQIIEDEELVNISKQKIKILKDIPFDID